MREPSPMRNKGARLTVPRSPWYIRHRWLLIGGIVDVGLLVVLFVLARKVLFSGAATVVVTVTAVVPSATSIANPTSAATPSPATLSQQIDAYIQQMPLTQKIGQLLMLSVYTNAYSSALDAPLQQTQVGGIVWFPNHNGGPLMPTTLSGVKQLITDIKAHATNPLLIATDEEGGDVDRLAPYYGRTPAPAELTATGDPQNAKDQAVQDAQRLSYLGINVDFAPLADVNQGGAIDASRMFGSSVAQVTQYAGAFLDGLQQHGIAGTLKHWPGIGAVPANPDYALPTLDHTQAQLNNIDFASFRALLSHQPDLIMVTHVLVPAYDQTYPASLSPTLINGVLRGQLGYQGVVVSDAMEATAITQFMQQRGYTNPAQGVGEASVLAILAGEDLIECPVDPTLEQGVVNAVTQAVDSGRISQARLQQSLERIIRLKVQLGILKLPKS
ncbi:MAG TPA: glycoside hydrolase family 3 N-terminal domain-containing protein [Ktedonobacterales bacterium]|nr:glycoside hydrolase family 3 N-terminal domain-containing protein [Ktedonobacterales bacterium]